MNDTLIVTVSVVRDDLLRAMRYRTDCRAKTSDSEVLTVAVCSLLPIAAVVAIIGAHDTNGE